MTRAGNRGSEFAGPWLFRPTAHARLRRRIFAYVEVAKPLTRSVLAQGADGKDPRIFFAVRTDF